MKASDEAASTTTDTGGRIKIGIAGWSYEDWKETVYPRGLKPGERLPFVARHFDCVEINSTFYAVPRPDLTTRWARVANETPGFLFTCKVVRTLTHERGKPEQWPAAADAFLRAIAPLVDSGALGAVLAQFPWFFRFSAENFDHVRRLGDLLGSLPLVFEIRHPSFLNDSFFGFLAERRFSLAGIDLPSGRRGPAGLSAFSHTSGPIGYFRFHGRNREAWFDPKAGRDQKYDYLYRTDELRPWVDRIRAAAAAAQRVFVITNNHYRGQAPANAIDIARLLGRTVDVPEPLAAAFPHLADEIGG